MDRVGFLLVSALGVSLIIFAYIMISVISPHYDSNFLNDTPIFIETLKAERNRTPAIMVVDKKEDIERFGV